MTNHKISSSILGRYLWTPLAWTSFMDALNHFRALEVNLQNFLPCIKHAYDQPLMLETFMDAPCLKRDLWMPPDPLQTLLFTCI